MLVIQLAELVLHTLSRNILDVCPCDVDVAAEVGRIIYSCTGKLESELAQLAKLHLVATLKLCYEIIYCAHQYCGAVSTGYGGLLLDQSRKHLERDGIVDLCTSIILAV